jgi:hypothetical protein
MKGIPSTFELALEVLWEKGHGSQAITDHIEARKWALALGLLVYAVEDLGDQRDLRTRLSAELAGFIEKGGLGKTTLTTIHHLGLDPESHFRANKDLRRLVFDYFSQISLNDEFRRALETHIPYGQRADFVLPWIQWQLTELDHFGEGIIRMGSPEGPAVSQERGLTALLGPERIA